MDSISDIMDTIKDLCFEAAVHFVLRRQAKCSFLVDQAARRAMYAAINKRADLETRA